ncbi:MAG TPA: gluconokinase [Blastocatellia bacterium]
MMTRDQKTMIIILMGVSGSGKTVIGRLLAERLGWTFYDADDFHPASNIEKMSQNQPLTDADRLPWLERLQQLVRTTLDSGSNAVLACSALKQEYRRYLLIDPRVRLVYLKGSFLLIQGRLSHRRGHFMPAALLESQFKALEEPTDAVTVDVSGTPDEIIGQIIEELSVR